MSSRRTKPPPKLTVAEGIAEALRFCCLKAMLQDSVTQSSRELAKHWGLSYGHICRLRKQLKSHDLKCTRSTKCIMALRKVPESHG